MDAQPITPGVRQVLKIDPLHDALATQAGEYAVNHYGQRLTRRGRMRLWKRHYDGALACLISYQELLSAQRIRRRAFECLN